uniref:Peptidase M16 middle/third domain-containing protein n=1 Tax=Lactuca sativa TaxID=4236 RepID=A0A9R1UZT0_LACSA|nr:hypothetical protein LSAT_V11C700365500 [Lactuca sativa]
METDWITAMQEELAEFERNKVWKLVPKLKGHTIINTRWVYKNKLDESGAVVRNKARLLDRIHPSFPGQPCTPKHLQLSAICEMTFHYQDKIHPIHYVVKFSSNMQLYPSKDWLVGSSLPSTFFP